MPAILVMAGMARSVYYYWQKASSKADPYTEVKSQINAIYHRHQGRYGYRRVHLELEHRQHLLNPKTVHKLMRQLGLKSTVRPKRYQSYKGTLGRMAPNLLERNFATKAPNQKWVTDVTEFNIKGDKVYLSPVLDLYNGEIISYEIADRPQIDMVMQMRAYQAALKERNIDQSMSRKGNCLDNAVMENWFGIMKTEFFYQKKFDDVQSFKAELEEYIHYYNHDRIKQKTKGIKSGAIPNSIPRANLTKLSNFRGSVHFT